MTYDFGAQPPKGTETGKVVIVYDGEVLVNQTIVAGLGQFTQNEYYLDFLDNQHVLAKNGDMLSGSATYFVTAVLYKADETNPAMGEEITSEPIMNCHQTWKAVP